MFAPDTKDWTWVIDSACPECGFDGPACEPPEVARLLRENAADWEQLLAEGVLRSGRPDDATWSTLEYAAHVRDVLVRYDTRVTRMRTEDDPFYENWDQDASAVEDRYDAQEPTAVVAALRAAAETIATNFDAVDGGAWDRPGRRSDGASFTIASISVYLVHDLVHHVWDVRRARERSTAS